MSGLGEILEENARLRAEMQAREAVFRTELQEKESLIAVREEAHRAELQDKLRLLDEAEAKVSLLEEHTSALEQQLALIRSKQSGPASQRYVPSEQQMPLFGTDDVVLPAMPPRKEAARGEAPKKRRGVQRRRTRDAVAHLPSRTVHCPADENAACAGCGKPLSVIGTADAFRVDWVPGRFVVHDVIRDKCACPNCPDQGVLTAPSPYALDKALCGNALLAKVLADRTADHIPLHRQSRRMAREGFSVSTATLSSWVLRAASLLTVVADAVRAELMTSPFLQGDDTGFPVQDGKAKGKKGALRKGRFWAFTDQTQVFYAFTDTKEGKQPAALLHDFEGDVFVADAGSEFNAVVADNGLTRAGCWSHLRSYFLDARNDHPQQADQALRAIADLFMNERALHGKSQADVLAMRFNQQKPIADAFFDWVAQLKPLVRPQSLLGKALTYANNQQKPLSVFLTEPRIPIHNNISELMLRQVVVGRKNWLFARSEGGAHAAATMYTLVASCMLQGVDPLHYLIDVLDRVQDHPHKRVVELTPLRWKPQNHAKT